ncbi:MULTISPECIES: cell division protein FtsZ [Azospira]|jgi:cell division protein FtsZ|uniref:Cell division protein FtsZ n=2 Tax=Azospira oryzae TaxID=146939 RepID=G8QMS2_AZOOP|nr:MULTISPECIES: cell division protein FtsZ [Azospira]TLS18488.1 MAG: cell division protein FtsZ [Betaproteobacteria bacterium]AEV24652.1 cell division protein FtsZ [Azospira oryzae PS]MBP7490179.1 cell division protein FtsZ [Azospira sp.]MDK9691675.1 cell division protein FtsZ [Azospira sp.]RZT90884.1 cell division protein FtsZ [Azospira oryzae]
MFEIIDKEESSGTVIKVVGVGGAGGNAVDHMIREGVNGVQFVAANTDAQALSRNMAADKMQLGASGLGAGAKPEAGRAAALEERERIAEQLKGANMVFITAGMGGGTGTGAAPIVAEVAKEMGILTVAVVTKPFGFEGKRLKAAEAGIAELQKHVDSLVVILNDKLMEVLGDDVSMEEAFKAADNVLRNAVGGIAEIINLPGLVNVDFEDVRTVMGEMGMAMMGSAYASGVDRARIAAEQAVASPLLEGINLSGARGVLVNITASRSLKMKEVNEVMKTIKEFAAEDAHIIFGAVFDEAMGEQLRVTVVATGLGKAEARRQSFEVINTAVRTGTDDAPMAIDYGQLDAVPAVIRKGRNATVEALANSGVDRYDIPAFLRKQAD